MQDDFRICFFGDSLINGTGDRQALGWTGRVCAAANQEKFIVTNYNLGVRRNTSQDVRARWHSEFEQRKVNNADCRIIFSFGVNDTVIENGKTRVNEKVSLTNARAIMKAASDISQIAWIGPTPVDEKEHNIRISHLSRRFNQLADELCIAYLPVFEPLSNNSIWNEEIRNGDGSHPDSKGYTVLSELILNWSDWWKFKGLKD